MIPMVLLPITILAGIAAAVGLFIKFARLDQPPDRR